MQNTNLNKNFKSDLNKIHLKATPARLAVIELFKKMKEPVDANTIICFVNKQKIKTNPSTIFRILNKLIGKGIISVIQFQEGKMRYELANRPHHHHLVCDKCGNIDNISGQFLCTLEKEIQDKHKFLVKRHSLEFFGLCVNCQK